MKSYVILLFSLLYFNKGTDLKISSNGCDEFIYCTNFAGSKVSKYNTMSWNKNFVIVTSADEPNYDEFFKGFEYNRFQDTDFNSVSNKNWSIVSVGYINGHIFITVPDHAHKLYSENISEFEIWLVNKYPNKTILSLNEDGTAGCYGFSYIINGERKRVLSGCEDEVYFECGQPIELESRLISEVLDGMDNDEKEEFLEDGQDALDRFVLSESRWRLPYSFLFREFDIKMDYCSDKNPKFVEYK